MSGETEGAYDASASLRRQYRVAKLRGFNQAVRRLRDLAPYSKDPAQVLACADLLATIGPDVPPSPKADSPSIEQP